MVLRMTGMLLGLTALVATPASAAPLKKASGLSEAHRQTDGEFTDMSARRKRHAVRHHSRHVKPRQVRHHRAARGAAPTMQMHLDPHGVGAAPVAVHPAAARAYASVPRRNVAPSRSISGGMPDVGGTGLVAEARRYIGGNPTGRSSLWCGHFMNLVLERSGHRASGSNTARSFASYGTRVSCPQVGAIAVMSRRGGGHVGVVSGIDANGNVIVISGNHNRRVAESVYPRSRIFAYVMP